MITVSSLVFLFSRPLTARRMFFAVGFQAGFVLPRVLVITRTTLEPTSLLLRILASSSASFSANDRFSKLPESYLLTPMSSAYFLPVDSSALTGNHSRPSGKSRRGNRRDMGSSLEVGGFIVAHHRGGRKG